MASNTNNLSFAQRAAFIMPNPIESWDDDGDFQGDLFTNSVSTVQTSMSSRVSVRSESNVGDDDWQVLITPNDELSTLNAISSAKQAGIPIPRNVPSSALLGGSIKRLGKKKSHRKIVADDDWGEDIELPTNPNEGLKLKGPQVPRTPAEDQDEFEDWGEGSLGIRFAGTKRDGRHRSSSISATMSPSMASCMTMESEEDDFTGLVLPSEPLDFNARLNKLKEAERTPDVSPLPSHQRPPTSAPTSVPVSAPIVTPPLPNEIPFEPEPEPQPKPAEEDGDDFFADLDIGAGDLLDTKKINFNRNVVVNGPKSKPTPPPAARPATTLTFTDKPAVSRIPRPMPSSSRTKLAPVYEAGAPAQASRPIPTTTSAQLLRAKRSAPLLRSHNYGSVSRPPVPFLPAGASTTSQSHHVTARSSQGHLRRDSDPKRPISPSMRTYSRMSTANSPDTPSRVGHRKDLGPAALLREASEKQNFKRAKRRVFGDGSELEIFDDLPTSATKEKHFEKVPSNRAPVAKVLRHTQSNSKLPLPDRIATPLPPPTPRSPTKADSTPRYLRDTAASRIAREQRLAGTRSRAEGPYVPPQTNWKATVAQRSPHASPTAQRKKGTGKKPMLIQAMSAPVAKNEKGMTYNPMLHRWEGNEDALTPFSHPNTSTTTLALTTASTPTFAPPMSHLHHGHDRSRSVSHTALSAVQAAHAHKSSMSSRPARVGPPSPPRAPALISNISSTRGVQVERGMIFDPRRMCWLKHGPSGDPMSPEQDEEDPFAGLDDLQDDVESKAGGTGGGPPSVISGFGDNARADEQVVGEEFDLGPSFIRRQKDEEANWRKRVDGWMGMRDSGESWRWAVRDLAAAATTGSSTRERAW